MKKIVTMLMTSAVLSAFMLDATADVRSACAEDIKTLCADVQPGGGRIKACIREHKDRLSEICKQALVDKAKDKK